MRMNVQLFKYFVVNRQKTGCFFCYKNRATSHNWPKNWTTYLLYLLSPQTHLKKLKRWKHEIIREQLLVFCSAHCSSVYMLLHARSNCVLLFLLLAAYIFHINFPRAKWAKNKITVHLQATQELMWKLCPHCNMKTYSAVSLLRSRCLPGEQDEFGAVLLQTLHVGLERLCGLVAAAGVNWDANCAGCLFVDASCLQMQTHWQY